MSATTGLPNGDSVAATGTHAVTSAPRRGVRHGVRRAESTAESPIRAGTDRALRHLASAHCCALGCLRASLYLVYNGNGKLKRLYTRVAAWVACEKGITPEPLLTLAARTYLMRIVNND